MGLLPDPTVVQDIDILVSESTYGNRELDPYDKLIKQLHAIVARATRLQSKVVIPAFSLGRTQRMVYCLQELFAVHKVRPIPVYVDSPLAIRLTEIHRDHPDAYTPARPQADGQGPACTSARSTSSSAQTWDDSRRLNYLTGPMIIIASSGMCEAGRIRHHLRHVVDDPDNAIVIVSYQAEGTLGRQIAEGVERIQIMDQWYDLNAAVYVLDGFSGHADRNDLAWWYEQTGGNIEHGVPRPRRARSDGVARPLLQPSRQEPRRRCPSCTPATRSDPNRNSPSLEDRWGGRATARPTRRDDQGSVRAIRNPSRQAVVREVPDPLGRAQVAGHIDEAAAPEDVQVGLDQGHRPAEPVDDRSIGPDLVVLLAVLTPLVNVAQHVEEPQVVGQQSAAGPRPAVRVQIEPGIALQQLPIAAAVAAGKRPGAAGKLPFGLGRQAVAGPLQGIGQDRHPLGVLVLGVGLIASLQLLAVAQPVAEAGRDIPARLARRAQRIRAELAGVRQPDLRVLLEELLELREASPPWSRWRTGAG